MKLLQLKMTMLSCTVCLTFVHAQPPPDWNTAGNNIIVNEWFGAQAGSTIPLRLKTEPVLDMQLFTNAGAGTFNNMRLRIMGNYSFTGGLIGIGDMNNMFTPNYLLQSYRTGNTDVFHQFTNDNTGIGNLEGFRIGIRYNNDPPFNPDYSIAELRNYEDSPENLIRFIFPEIFPHRTGI